MEEKIIAHAVINGKVPAKSNCYRIGKMGSRCTMFKGKDLTDYEKSFGLQLSAQAKQLGYDKEFMIILNVYFANARADIDNSLKVILDCLQHNGVVVNDNLCYTITVNKYIDKEKPRVEFWVYSLD